MYEKIGRIAAYVGAMIQEQRIVDLQMQQRALRLTTEQIGERVALLARTCEEFHAAVVKSRAYREKAYRDRSHLIEVENMVLLAEIERIATVGLGLRVVIAAPIDGNSKSSLFICLGEITRIEMVSC